MKVYIIPSGWDRELVIKTAFKAGADKICLLSATQKKDHIYSKTDAITQKVTEDILKELSKFTVVEILEVNYIDMKDIFVRVKKYITQHKDAEIIINISTGSRLLSSTLLLVAYMNNIDIEYSVAQNHNPHIMALIEKGEDYHNGFNHVLRFPSIPFTFCFSAKEKALLKRIKQEKVLSVSSFISGTKGDMENRLRSEFHYLSKKLEKQGFVDITTKGKNVELRLSSLGELHFED